jgi:hypothetical protein
MRHQRWTVPASAGRHYTTEWSHTSTNLASADVEFAALGDEKTGDLPLLRMARKHEGRAPVLHSHATADKQS